jgi:carboxylesterase
MRPLAERCANAGFTVELPRLPGHGTSVADMMTTGWSDWSQAAVAAYDDLAARCVRVAVVGLSMGGGLTAFVAQQRPDVAALAFVNPLVKPFGADIRTAMADLIAAGLETVESIGSDIKKEASSELSYDATPIACGLSLMEGLDEVYDHLGQIVAPSVIFTSREDHVVDTSNSDELAAALAGPVEHLWLENSYHVATLDHDAPFIEETTIRFLQGVFA